MSFMRWSPEMVFQRALKELPRGSLRDGQSCITVQNRKTLPILDRRWTCCTNFHCPFYSSTLFNPTQLGLNSSWG
ncbi:hypothetical protein ATANTOWER_008446 [Ataeniobius toweri]|uniref:Uncharacterized protein n=1 Tax=Ataeniobius toweri TaxID=208326 RepID=A0ABU7C7B3_9TELE|nr:hypothetical protein [Ataeniobius toweri]